MFNFLINFINLNLYFKYTFIFIYIIKIIKYFYYLINFLKNKINKIKILYQ